ncbi:hypothetical protein BCR44DRAFT_1540928 [Catenaria anguillulae PL171]|uniref:Uncharacterized protein n=1 Tax=Catenaria anguillulae PL171 TaxID=765915 RepID=A0A1Y2HYR1_9FUNG|nr:hypothetical protein BCR44DRAFT_1540928 [Catenaria anguillulae PL171]
MVSYFIVSVFIHFATTASYGINRRSIYSWLIPSPDIIKHTPGLVCAIHDSPSMGGTRFDGNMGTRAPLALTLYDPSTRPRRIPSLPFGPQEGLTADPWIRAGDRLDPSAHTRTELLSWDTSVPRGALTSTHPALLPTPPISIFTHGAPDLISPFLTDSCAGSSRKRSDGLACRLIQVATDTADTSAPLKFGFFAIGSALRRLELAAVDLRSAFQWLTGRDAWQSGLLWIQPTRIASFPWFGWIEADRREPTCAVLVDWVSGPCRLRQGAFGRFGLLPPAFLERLIDTHKVANTLVASRKRHVLEWAAQRRTAKEQVAARKRALMAELRALSELRAKMAVEEGQRRRLLVEREKARLLGEYEEKVKRARKEAEGQNQVSATEDERKLLSLPTEPMEVDPQTVTQTEEAKSSTREPTCRARNAR